MDLTAKEGIKNDNSHRIFQEVRVGSTFSRGEIPLNGFYCWKKKGHEVYHYCSKDDKGEF